MHCNDTEDPTSLLRMTDIVNYGRPKLQGRRTLGLSKVSVTGDAIRIERKPTVAVRNPAATAPSGRPSLEAMAVSQEPHNIPALRSSRRR
jgi:hypothetical protein